MRRTDDASAVICSFKSGLRASKFREVPYFSKSSSQMLEKDSRVFRDTSNICWVVNRRVSEPMCPLNMPLEPLVDFKALSHLGESRTPPSVARQGTVTGPHLSGEVARFWRFLLNSHAIRTGPHRARPEPLLARSVRRPRLRAPELTLRDGAGGVKL